MYVLRPHFDIEYRPLIVLIFRPISGPPHARTAPSTVPRAASTTTILETFSSTMSSSRRTNRPPNASCWRSQASRNTLPISAARVKRSGSADTSASTFRCIFQILPSRLPPPTDTLLPNTRPLSALAGSSKRARRSNTLREPSFR